MYIAEAKKSDLKEQAGQCVRLNATRVYQPHNPGDSLIGQFKYLGPALKEVVPVNGLRIGVTRASADGEIPAFLITLRNVGQGKIRIQSSELAPTLLTYQEPSARVLSDVGGSCWSVRNLYSASDGPSVAVITRQGFWNGDEARWQIGSRSSTSGKPYSWTISEASALPERFTIGPGAEKRIKIRLGLQAGEYDFFCGYGGQVHAGRSLAGNLVAFNVDRRHRGKAIRIPGR